MLLLKSRVPARKGYSKWKRCGWCKKHFRLPSRVCHGHFQLIGKIGHLCGKSIKILKGRTQREEERTKAIKLVKLGPSQNVFLFF